MSFVVRLLLVGFDQDKAAQLKTLLPEQALTLAPDMAQALAQRQAQTEATDPFDLYLLNAQAPDLDLSAFAPGPLLLVTDRAEGQPIPPMPQDSLWDWIDLPCEPRLIQNRINNLLKCRNTQAADQTHYLSLRTLSHDLRTPMATIGVTLSSIQRMLNKKPIAEIVPKLDKIRRALERQQQILEEALRIKAGRPD